MGSLYDIIKYVGLALSILAVIVVALLWFDVLLSTSRSSKKNERSIQIYPFNIMVKKHHSNPPVIDI